MTIQEKSRAYDKALSRARKIHETCDNENVIRYCEEIFPELEYTKEQRIRAGLLKMFDRALPDVFNRYGIDKNDAIEYLSDSRLECFDELIDANETYQMSVNDEMTEYAREKTINVLKKLSLYDLLIPDNTPQNNDSFKCGFLKCNTSFGLFEKGHIYFIAQSCRTDNKDYYDVRSDTDRLSTDVYVPKSAYRNFSTISNKQVTNEILGDTSIIYTFFDSVLYACNNTYGANSDTSKWVKMLKSVLTGIIQGD